MFHWWALGQRDFALMMDAVARYKLHEGTKSLLEAMLADGQPEVRLSTPVSRVEQEAEQVRITTPNGVVLSAQAAIVAVPLNVLAAITFATAALCRETGGRRGNARRVGDLRW